MVPLLALMDTLCDGGTLSHVTIDQPSINIQNCTNFLIIYFAFDNLFLRLTICIKKYGTEPHVQTF